MLNAEININYAKEVRGLILEAERILLVGHKNPDGDTIGCLTAMMEYLGSVEKNYAAFLIDGVPGNLEYLRHSYEIKSDKKVLGDEYDVIVCLDTADMNYSGLANELDGFKKRGRPIVNIDHHPSDYGDFNIVDSSASSTSVILYDLFKIWEVSVNKNIATSLLAGIMVDTMNFSNSATNEKSIELSAELIRAGGRLGIVNRELYRSKTANGLKLWSRVLKRLAKNDKLNVAYSVILSEDIEEAGIEETEGMSNFFGNLRDSKISMVIKEIRDGEIKVSMRAIDDKVDVAKLAQLFGGGGHKKAAGFSLAGRLEQEGSGWRVI